MDAYAEKEPAKRPTATKYWRACGGQGVYGVLLLQTTQHTSAEFNNVCSLSRFFSFSKMWRKTTSLKTLLYRLLLC